MSNSHFIELDYIAPTNAPAGVDHCDQYSPALPRYFIERYTEKSDHVFDPFMGFGTTAFVAEELGRVPFGVEADGERFEWGAGQLTHWQNVRHGDAADLAGFGFPEMDFCVTSPPFMRMYEDWNPLYGGDPNYAGYDAYLARMGFIFGQMARVMKRGALVVVQVDNIATHDSDGRFTPLVRDFSNVISSKLLRPVGEVIVRWREGCDDYPFTQCLVFERV